MSPAVAGAAPSRDLVALRMRGAAHHLDLRTPNEADPPDVRAARETMLRRVGKWAAEGRRPAL